MIARFGLAVLLSITSCSVIADCVVGAMASTKFTRLNNKTIVLSGGYSDDIIIRTSCLIRRNSEIAILKDSFCNASKAVLYVDGQECDAEDVTRDEHDTRDEEDTRDEPDTRVD